MFIPWEIVGEDSQGTDAISDVQSTML